MNNNTTSQYMDKQIMDLSNSQSTAAADNNGGSNSDFIDFMNRPPEKKDDIVPSYEFMPIRPAVGSSSPKAARPSNFDSGDDDAPLRTWNSLDSRPGASPIRNYNSIDADEPAKFVLGNNHKPSNASLDASLVSEIDKTMKKYMDNLTHAVDNMSARLSQLETRTRNLEHSIDDLKVSVGNNHGITDGKMRLLENILNEVQAGVELIRDKQEVVEAQVQIAKMLNPKVEQVESKNTAHMDSTQTGVPTHQQYSTVSPAQPPPPNAPPPPPPQHNLQPQVQFPNQFPQNQPPSIPQRESYFPSPGQTPENPNQQYQLPAPPPPLQLQQHHPGAPPSQLQYSQQPPPPQPQYSQPPPPPSQPHPSFPPANPSLPQQPIGNHLPEESMYAPPQTYPSGIRPPPPSQQYYSPTNVYEPPSNKPALGYSSSFGPSSGHGDPYPYSSSPSKYGGNNSPVKAQHMGQSGGSGYPQLPTARILPQALPAAAAVGGGGGGGSGSSGGSGNRVPIDDVVDRVTNMGFPRDQVRATVKKLTENGQAVDLNIVLDKLMNDGDGRNWFGR
ncbi:hypothetical protein ABFS83_08G008600 [Erythranthe nasuta]